METYILNERGVFLVGRYRFDGSKFSYVQYSSEIICTPVEFKNGVVSKIEGNSVCNPGLVYSKKGKCFCILDIVKNLFIEV